MWNRVMLKENAKMPLRQTYWTAFVVSLVGGILISLFSGGNSSTGSQVSNSVIHGGDTFIGGYMMPYGNISEGFLALAILALALMFGFVLSIVGLVYQVFVGNIIYVGETKFFIENRKYPAKFSMLFDGFKENYIKKVLAMGMKSLYVFLWTLLFVIPGIIAEYSYFAVPYLMVENPNMPWQVALDISKRMTRGRKLDLWILDLSFIGWYIIGAMACGVGIFFVNPYFKSTKAEAYEFLKQEAFQMGKVNPNELQG